MREPKKSHRIKTALSGIYLLVAVCVLLGVCSHCYPQIGQKARQIIAGATDSPAREAFGVLTEGLSESRTVKEVLSRSYEVLTGENT